MNKEKICRRTPVVKLRHIDDPDIKKPLAMEWGEYSFHIILSLAIVVMEYC